MKRRIVVSDIHGMLDLFKKTLKDVKYNSKEDQLIILGDFVDRGNKIFETVEYVIQLQKEGNVIALLGNHDDMLLDAIEDYRYRQSQNWSYNGGGATAKSYADNKVGLDYHRRWFESLPLSYEDEDFFYCHAGIDPLVDLDKQERNTLIWTREEFFNSPVKMPKPIMFGHTPQQGGYKFFPNGCLGIDAGLVYYGGMLSVVIEDGSLAINYSTKNKFVKAVEYDLDNLPNW